LHYFYTKMLKKFDTKNRLRICFVISSTLLYLIPLIIAFLSIDSLWSPDGKYLKLPFLRDYNVMFMSTIAIPFLFCFLLVEKEKIPESVASAARKGILKPKGKDYKKFLNIWRNIYKWVNIGSIPVGITIGIFVSYANYSVFSQQDFGGWQMTDNQLNLPGWIFILWQLPITVWIFSIYVMRNTTTMFFLHYLVKKSEIHLDPFHQDKSAGLKKVGELGLRNQYILMVLGCNLLLYGYVGNIFSWDKAFIFLMTIMIFGYLLVGIFAFVGPLLPFRKVMLETKKIEVEKISNVLTNAYKDVLYKISNESISKEAWENISHLLEFQKAVKNIPVWPLDIETIKKFLKAYLIPPITGIISLILKQLFELANQLFIHVK